MRRSVEAYERGFKHIIFDDNAVFYDNYNCIEYCFMSKLVDQVSAQYKFAPMRDNFYKSNISSVFHEQLSNQMASASCAIETLFPMWVSSSLREPIDWKRAPESLKHNETIKEMSERILHDGLAVKPLMSEETAKVMFAGISKVDEPSKFNYMQYVRLCDK